MTDGASTLIIDADDTLWENNIHFEEATERFLDLVETRGGEREPAARATRSYRTQEHPGSRLRNRWVYPIADRHPGRNNGQTRNRVRPTVHSRTRRARAQHADTVLARRQGDSAASQAPPPGSSSSPRATKRNKETRSSAAVPRRSSMKSKSPARRDPTTTTAFSTPTGSNETRAGWSATVLARTSTLRWMLGWERFTSRTLKRGN